MSDEILNLNRQIVLNDYASAQTKNQEAFLSGDAKATSEYIYDNQRLDASVITDKFYTTDVRVVSIVKRTKVGMNGLMIELAKIMTTHEDNSFALHRSNILFATAMSSVAWEEEMKDNIPNCFADNVYHHGKLQRLKTKLLGIQNALLILDEIDTGDKEGQKLHMILKESGILDMKYMEENNIRFVFVSATMINELRQLCKWGDKHFTYYMTIPESYIGHKEFLEMCIIQEYYPVNSEESAERWIRDDILENYGTDFRVHMIRSTEKNMVYIKAACVRNNIRFECHTSEDRIIYENLSEIFTNITRHVVIAVKGFYRRANLIPNIWKMKIGAMHEKHCKKYDTNVQVQAFPGRMTGFWREIIMGGFKTGPYRTSVDAILEYEAFYENPLGETKYHTTGSKKLFVHPKNVKNLEVLEQIIEKIDNYRVYSDENITKEVCRILGYKYVESKSNSEGFKITSLNQKKEVASLEDAISKVASGYGGASNGTIARRTFFPCYVDPTDKNTLRFVVIIRTDADLQKVINEIDPAYPQVLV